MCGCEKIQYKEVEQPTIQLDKILLVGDRGVGKTSLTLRYASRGLSQEYQSIPTTDLRISNLGNTVQTSLYALPPPGPSLAGYTTERDQWGAYLHTSCILICFDLSDPESLVRINTRWGPETRYFFKKNWRGWWYWVLEDRWARFVRMRCEREGRGLTPVIIVGCKKDLRNKGGVTSTKGCTVAKRFNASLYLECSAATGEGVDEVFQQAAHLALLAATSRVDRSWLKRLMILMENRLKSNEHLICGGHRYTSLLDE